MRKYFAVIIFLFTFFCFSISQNKFFDPDPLINIVNNVKIDSLTYYVRGLSGNIPIMINGTFDAIQTRNSNAGNDKAAQYLKEKLISFKMDTYEQVFSTSGKNIYGMKIGYKNPKNKVIICAHYDDMPSGNTAPGADDNGSGTATVLEAARVLKDFNFPFTLVFAFWDEEEQGLRGSSYFANNLKTTDDSVLAVVNIDMIGYDGNNDNLCEIHTSSKGISTFLSNKMSDLNIKYGIGLTTRIKNPGTPNSDQQSFWNNNYRAVLLIEDYTGDFNPNYHTVRDILDANFKTAYFERCAKLSILTVSYYAFDSENPNTSIKLSPFKNSSPLEMKIFPNPFNSSTQIRFILPKDEFTKISVYNTLGNKITDLSEGRLYQGEHIVNWNVKNLSTGLYFVKIQTESGFLIEKTLYCK